MNNKKQELKNNLEDAYFALIMDDLSEADGARLLEECERLNADSSAAVPESLHMKCMEVIDNHFAKERNAQLRHRIKSRTKKALLVAAIIAALFTTAFATIEGFRVNVLNFVLDMQEKYSTLLFTDLSQPENGASENGASESATKFCDNQLSVDFDLTEFEILENTSDKYSTFLSLISPENGQTASIQCTKVTEELICQIDTEKADDIRDILIGGNAGYIVIKDSRNHVIWIDSASAMMIEVITTDMTIEQTVALAESITYVQN